MLTARDLVDMQGVLVCVEGISLQGLGSDPAEFEGLTRMPKLRILILDGVKAGRVLSGMHATRLAMLSWRGADGPLLPLNFFDIIKSAAVLDMSGGDIKRLPSNLQVCIPPCSHACDAVPVHDWKC